MERSILVNVGHRAGGARFDAQLAAFARVTINTWAVEAHSLNPPADESERTEELAPGAIDEETGAEHQDGASQNGACDIELEDSEGIDDADPIQAP